MAVLIRMPEVLAGVTEAAVQAWLVGVGDDVSADTPLAEIETEKAMVEFSGEHAGSIAELLVPAGETVPVGQPIVILREAGDSEGDLDAVRALAGAGTGTVAAAPTTPVDPAAAPDTAAGAAVAPAATPVTGVAETSPSSEGRRLFSSPLVRRLAIAHDIDLAQVAGTGPNGRIVRRDVEAYLAAKPDPVADEPRSAAPSAAAPEEPGSRQSAAAPADDLPGTVIPLTGMRRAIARRLTESKSTVPHFYLTAHCNVDELLALRKTVNETSQKKISVNDFVVKAAAQALIEVPGSNAIWGGDHLRHFDTADIAVAVSTEGGLMTPVVRNAESLSLTALSETIAELAGRARDGRLKQHELEGGSFSISNLGMYGVDEFSAILNPPQSGILAVGAATQRAIVVDGELRVGTVMTVTLSADHRVVDGALGAQWLQAFRTRIEQPLSILL